MPDNPLSSIAIIPDGNRRYARKAGLSLEQAYMAGFRKSEDAVKWSADEGAKTLTFWALSLDNFTQRSSNELSVLFRLMKSHAQQALKSKVFKEHNVAVRFFGKRELLPRELDRTFQTVEEKYPGDGDLALNVGIAYNGRDELLHAAQLLAKDISANKVRPGTLTESEFEQYLYVKVSPDLVIRTGDAPRLSGLMPWQTVYSELYFSPKLWPEFTKEDFGAACEFYHNVERKFGR